MCVITRECVTWLFSFCYPGEDAMGGGLEGINQYNMKHDTSLDVYKSPPSL